MSERGSMRPGELTLADDLIQAFMRLAKGDFSVRLPRNLRRDQDDVLAYFVNLIAEELGRLQVQREQSHGELERRVNALSELFLNLAAGDFSVRAQRSFRGDPFDVLAFMFNNTAAEVGEAVAETHRQGAVLAAILDSMIDGVLLLEPSGVVVRANAAMGQVLGSTAAALVGVPLAELLDPRDHELAVRLVALVGAAPLRDRRTTFRARSGELVSLSVNASGQWAASGALAGVVLVVRDDRELRQMQAQLHIADRLTTMGMVAAGVAHEINNPLAFVAANLDFVREEVDELAAGVALGPERMAELLRALVSTQNGVQRVTQIVRDLKSFSRSDEAALVRADVNRLVESALGFVRADMRHHARLVKELGAVPPVEANEGRLVQVFLNLVQNAAQAIAPGDVEKNQIRIVTGTTDAGEAFVEVHDTGVGIPKENLARVFELFFTTKPIGVGTGLGLSICHRIVQGLGGRIDVASEVGKGSVFRVTLPPQRGEGEPVGPSSEPGRPARRLRVLVVDDEVEIGRAVMRILGREHEVEMVTGASEAMARLLGGTWDLVLCDLLMPEMTGVELYATLREQRPELAQRVVFMTGASSAPQAHALPHGASTERIDKPFDARTLRELAARWAVPP